MDGTAVIDEAALAALHERFQPSAFGLAYRLTGSEADAAAAVQRAFLDAAPELPQLAGGERALGLHLLAATRNACYDLLGGRQPSRPNGTPPESPREEVGAASMRLPEHQREALALRGLELSYEEIATVMETSRNSVAQLISRARINLSDELRGTALASVAAPSPECERALPLIAARDDGQLDAASRDAAWLDAHLAGCERCGLGVEVMEEARAAYRTWKPLAAPPAPDRRKPPRRRVTLAAALASLLLLAGLTAALAGRNPPATPAGPAAAASATPAKGVGVSEPARAGRAKTGAGARGKRKAKALTTAVEATAFETTPAPAQVLTGGGASGEPASGPTRPSGKSAVQPPRQVSAPKSGSRSQPAPAPSSASPSTTVQAAPETSPPAQETSKKEPPGQAKGHEPPGKATGRPPR
jgi:DNA-directed RNA polymerase specialized sigma24 family protein